MTIEGKKGATTFARDEHPFADASMKLGKLSPVFSGRNHHGGKFFRNHGWRHLQSIAAAFMKQNNLKPCADPVASAGVDPRTIGIGPVPAMRKLEDKHNLRLQTA